MMHFVTCANKQYQNIPNYNRHKNERHLSEELCLLSTQNPPWGHAPHYVVNRNCQPILIVSNGLGDPLLNKRMLLWYYILRLSKRDMKIGIGLPSRKSSMLLLKSVVPTSSLFLLESSPCGKLSSHDRIMSCYVGCVVCKSKTRLSITTQSWQSVPHA